jgi:hypothetical protein
MHAVDALAAESRCAPDIAVDIGADAVVEARVEDGGGS